MEQKEKKAILTSLMVLLDGQLAVLNVLGENMSFPKAVREEIGTIVTGTTTAMELIEKAF